MFVLVYAEPQLINLSILPDQEKLIEVWIPSIDNLVVKRGPKSRAQGFNISTKDKISVEKEELERNIREAGFNYYIKYLDGTIYGRKIKVFDKRPEGLKCAKCHSPCLNYPTEEYFIHYPITDENSPIEPSCYVCKEGDKCTGKIRTPSGCLLDCWNSNCVSKKDRKK